MKMSQSSITRRLHSTSILILLLTICLLSASISAQKGPLAPEAIGVNIEQCANGPLAAPIPCNSASGNDGYTRGNVNESKSHYYEGQFLPIRFIAEDLVVGQQYTVTLGYDYTKGGKYANDYLGDYDETESSNNNPCVNVVGCTLAGVNTFPIPLDPEVFNGFDQSPGGTDNITQLPGNFSCFGCTITGVTPYTRTGVQTGDSTKTFTLTFTANKVNIVIAYASHISARSDWGVLNSAVNISGSPYHNYVVDFPGANGGSRDLQLSASAVIFPARITIEKTVVGYFLETSATFQFGFTSSGALFPGTSFNLIDSIAEPFNADPTQRVGGTIDSLGITNFGSGNLITVTENASDPWSLGALTCTSTGGVNNNTINLGTRSVSIQLEEGEYVKCSFHNTQLTPSAAPVSINGRVSTSEGNGIRGAVITVTNVGTGETRIAITGAFGYYGIEDLEAGSSYVVSIASKRYNFPMSSVVMTLDDNVSGLDFVATP